MAYGDAEEQIIAFRFSGIQDAPRLFEQAAAGVKKLDESIQALQKNQGQLQTQFNAAPASQQPTLQKQINKVEYQLAQAVQQREQSMRSTEDQYRSVQQFNDLSRRLQAIEQKRSTSPPPPAPPENLSLGAAQDYAYTRGELEHAQQKFSRARTDTSRQKWSQEIDKLQGELSELPSQLVTTAYKEPMQEIRRRLQDFQATAGRAATNTEYLGIERGVAQGHVSSVEESDAITARRMAATAPERGRLQKFGHTIRENLMEGGGLNIGFSLMYGAEGIANAFTPQMSGQRVTGEAQQRANAGLLPTVGGLIGTAVVSILTDSEGPVLLKRNQFPKR